MCFLESLWVTRRLELNQCLEKLQQFGYKDSDLGRLNVFARILNKIFSHYRTGCIISSGELNDI